MKTKITLFFIFIVGCILAQSSPQTYTTPGNYIFTVPNGVNSLTIEILGAGGDGGINGGGGGGGGGYAKGVYSVVPGSTLDVTVGNHGGSALGTTSVSTFILATGGGNGSFVFNPNVGGGGSNGFASGGTILNSSGGLGGGGYYTYFGGGGGGAGGPLFSGSAIGGGNSIVYNGSNCLYSGGSAGASGGAPGGAGGKGSGFINSGCTLSDNPTNGTFGGGGGGGNGVGSTPGIGGNGYCQITWVSCPVPNAPTNTGLSQTICANSSGSLSVQGNNINWYSSPTSSVVLSTGNNYTTPSLTAGSYSYYAASTNTCGEGPRVAVPLLVNSLPSAPTNVSSNQAICVNSSGSLSVQGNNINWYSSPTSSAVLSTGNNYTTPSLTVGNYSYYAASTNSCGEGPRLTVTLAVNALPTVNASSNTSLLCVGQTASLTASGANTYSWSTNATSSVIAVTPTITTSYTVVGTNVNGCKNSATITQSVSTCTGISKNNNQSSGILIYPNPNKGDFTISTDAEMNFSIVNNLGQVVMVLSNNKSNNYTSPVTNLASGVYFIVGEKNNTIIKQKIVVAK